jgi:hypothetical protein
MTEQETPDKHRTLLSILIALAAVTGALVSWHALRVGGAASGEDGKAVTAALDEAASESAIASEIFGYLTNARRFQLHRDNAKAVREDAMKNAAVPDRWLDEWQGESIRAQARIAELDTDFLKTEGGRWTFDRERYERTRRSQIAMEKALDPAPFIERSAAKRREANLLVSFNALFAAAIFLFTVALKTDLRGKLVWTAAGGLAYLAGAGLALWRVLA